MSAMDKHAAGKESLALRQRRARRRGIVALVLALLAGLAGFLVDRPLPAEQHEPIAAVPESPKTAVEAAAGESEVAASSDDEEKPDEAEAESALAAMAEAREPLIAGEGESGPGDGAAEPQVEAAAVPVAAALAEVPVAASAGYRLQLGVFGDPANALALQQRLAALELPAGIQSRVIVGPFPDREAARQAQSKLKAAGIDESVLLLPERRNGGVGKK